uniref:Nitrogenase iron protein n=1 Tax=Parastrongyloides trichosuri TaxID=131310 RepID=A0A0N4ZGT7_PARTI
RHEHLEHAAADDVLLALAGVFLAQLVEALHAAVLVDDDDDRIGFGHHGLGEGQAFDQVLGDGFGIGMGGGRACPFVRIDLAADQMQAQHVAVQRDVDAHAGCNARQRAYGLGLFRP